MDSIKTEPLFRFNEITVKIKTDIENWQKEFFNDKLCEWCSKIDVLGATPNHRVTGIHFNIPIDDDDKILAITSENDMIIVWLNCHPFELNMDVLDMTISFEYVNPDKATVDSSIKFIDYTPDFEFEVILPTDLKCWESNVNKITNQTYYTFTIGCSFVTEVSRVNMDIKSKPKDLILDVIPMNGYIRFEATTLPKDRHFIRLTIRGIYD